MLTKQGVFQNKPTLNKFHDNHDRLPHSSDADELDDILMVVLFEYSAFLEEFLLLVIWEGFLTRLDSDFQILWFVITSVYVSKVTLVKKEHINDILKSCMQAILNKFLSRRNFRLPLVILKC